MAVASSFSILLIRLAAAKSNLPPSTLAQVKQLVTDDTVDTQRWNAGPRGLPTSGKALLDLFGNLSARYASTQFMCLHEFEPARLRDLLMAVNGQRPPFNLSLGCIVDRPIAPDFMTVGDPGAIVHIRWRVTESLPDLSFFRTFSRAGVWNHLLLEGAAANPANAAAIRLQPNIMHSWEIGHADRLGIASNSAYDQVRRLPGRPLWQAMNDPLQRFLLVNRLTKDRLLRLRINDDNQHLFTVGENLNVHFVPPDRLPNGHLDEICAMVAAGGTVATTHVRSNLKRAFLIGYAEEKGIIVGNSSLKHPRPQYIEFVRNQSGLDLTGFVERGYTSVRPEYRGLGIGTTLLAGLTQRAGGRKIFSVIAEDNVATKVIARRNRTRKVATYYSTKTGKPVGIWMPEWIIDQ